MRRVLLAGLVLAAGVCTGCQSGGEVSRDVSGEEAGRRLEGQRDDVRASVAALTDRASRDLSGRVAGARGRWEGCESTFNDQFATFRYAATARIDAGPDAARPYLDAVPAALEAAGFADPTPGERPGGTTLEAGRGGLTATFAELPEQGDYVLLTVAGDCVEVPEDDREDWPRRDDPEPIV